MKKAFKKQLEQIIKPLPEIPLLQGGLQAEAGSMIMGKELFKSGIYKDKNGDPINPTSFYYEKDKSIPQYINKVNFFVASKKAGISVNEAVDNWLQRYKAVQKLILDSKAKQKDEVDKKLETKTHLY